MIIVIALFDDAVFTWHTWLHNGKTESWNSICLPHNEHELLRLGRICAGTSVTSKKLPNVCKNCPKMIPVEKLKILTP